MRPCTRCGKTHEKGADCILEVLGVRVDMSPGRNCGNIIRDQFIDLNNPNDYGSDPLGDGTFRMVPSGDIVDYA